MPFPEDVPVLTDGVVRLRAHRPEDLPRIVEQSLDPLSLKFTTIPRPYGAAQAQEFLDVITTSWADPDGTRFWALTDANDPDELYLGTIDWRPRGGGRADVGFGLHPQGRGRQLMSGALRLLAEHWFAGGGQTLEWEAQRGNFGSWAVARAAGFTQLPTRDAHLPLPEGGLVDTWQATLRAGDPLRPKYPWYTPPVLAADGVRLRPWRDEDGAQLEESADPPHHFPAQAVLEPATFADWLLRRREGMAWGRRISWCITDATDDPLGELLIFTHADPIAAGDTAELGYQLQPRARGKGLTKIASRLALDYVFASPENGGLGIRRVLAVTAADNEPSNGVLTGLGFTKWGHELDGTAPDGSVGPAFHWSLNRDEWAARH